VTVPSQAPISGSRRRRDSNILLGLAAICLLGITGLWLVTRHADSAFQQELVSLPIVIASGEDGCTNFAEFWMDEAGVGITSETITHLSNCRQDAEGNWFVPKNARDNRLTSESTLTADEAEAVAPLRGQIREDLADLEDEIPRSLQEAFKANYDAVNQPVFGHTRKGAPALGDKRTRYLRVARAFLASPDHAALADYVAWVIDRKQAASDEFLAACYATSDLKFLARACSGVPGEFQAGFVPLLWDLNDPVLMQEYLAERARTGEPLPGPTPAMDTT
jgi:hypothetical protein